MPEKKLKPSLKENKRYLLIEGNASRKEIETALLNFLGVLGYSKLGLYFISDEILAINREEVDKVRAGLTVNSKLIKVRKVFGTLKKLRS